MAFIMNNNYQSKYGCNAKSYLKENFTKSETDYKGHTYLNENNDDDNDPSSCYSPKSSCTCKDTNIYYTPSSILTPSLFPNVPPFITFSSYAEMGPAVPKDLRRILKWKKTNSVEESLRYVLTNTGFQLLTVVDDWIGAWYYKHSGELREYQKVRGIPGISSISQKDNVWRNINRKINKFGTEEFGFMQKTYILPEDQPELRETLNELGTQQTIWIVKPAKSSQGKGIYLVSKLSEIQQDEGVIVQRYIDRPLLINKTKFDLRIYVLVTSINPLRIFIHKEGIAKFATVKYNNKIESISNRFMHITNYSVNKFSQNYRTNKDIHSSDSNRWSLTALWTYLQTRKINTELVWGKIRDMVVRTIIAGENEMNQKMEYESKYNYYSLLGFDIMLDENLTPWLCETNNLPWMNADTPVDRHVNGLLCQAVFTTVGFQIPPLLTYQQEDKILAQFNLTGPLCFDRRIYTTYLSPEEMKKHKRFTSDAIKGRNDYLDSILDNLTPDDIRCLIVAEDELARSSPMERLFPGPKCHKFLQFWSEPRYYNRLLDAWEMRYASKRDEGIRLLQKFCLNRTHLVLIPVDEDSDEDIRIWKI